ASRKLGRDPRVLHIQTVRVSSSGALLVSVRDERGLRSAHGGNCHYHRGERASPGSVRAAFSASPHRLLPMACPSASKLGTGGQATPSHGAERASDAHAWAPRNKFSG